MYPDPICSLEREWPQLLERGLPAAFPPWREPHRLAEWSQLLDRPLQLAFPGWRRNEPALRPFASAEQLLAFLHANPFEKTDPVMLALLSLARTDRLAGRLVLQAILPALKARAARLLRREVASYAAIWELLLFCGWQAICCYPQGRERLVAANLVLQVVHDIDREFKQPFRFREQACTELTLELLNHPTGDEEPAAVIPGSEERLLNRAVDAGVIVEEDAQLILDTRLDGVSLRSLADAQSVSYYVLKMRRVRAEAALRAWLQRKEFVTKRPVLVLTSSATPRWRTRPNRPRTRPHIRAEQGGRPRRRGVAPTRPEPGRRHA